MVEKVSALTKLPVEIRIVAKDLTDSEQENILELMEGSTALLRFDKPLGSSKWVCAYVADPDVIHHHIILAELAMWLTFLLHDIRKCPRSFVNLLANS